MATRPAANTAAPKAAPEGKKKTGKAAPAAAPAVTGEIAVKEKKPARPKLVRDSFSFPKPDYDVLQQLKDRAAKLGRPAKKNEVLRAGVQALAAMGDAAFLASVGGLPAAKPAKPAKPRKAA